MNVAEPAVAIKSRRLKIFTIDQQHMFDIIRRGLAREWHPGAMASFIYILDRWPFPADAKVVRIAYDSWELCFGFMVEHGSFPEVPEGCPVPRVGWGELHYRAVEVPTLVDDDRPTIVPAS